MPDPFTRDLDIRSLQEMQKQPTILSNYTAKLDAINMRAPLDNFIRQIGAGSEALVRKIVEVTARKSQTDSTFNHALLSTIVLYCGVNALQNMPKGGFSAADVSSHHVMQLYVQLSKVLQPEGRYHLLNAMANHLRHPNSHTHFFLRVILCLFDHPKMTRRNKLRACCWKAHRA